VIINTSRLILFAGGFVAKRRGESTASYKLRKRQRMNLAPNACKTKGRLSPLEKKANEIARLAGNHQLNVGAETFLFLLRKRKYLPRIRQLYPRKKQQRAFVIELSSSYKILCGEVSG